MDHRPDAGEIRLAGQSSMPPLVRLLEDRISLVQKSAKWALERVREALSIKE